MAGIGFELKKLFDKKGIFQGVKAYTFSAVTTVGPSVMSILLIIILQAMLKQMGIAYDHRQMLTGSIVYGFIFSQLLTSGFGMIITRYISDRLLYKQNDRILASFYGVLTICLLIGSIVGGIFYWRSPIENIFKILAYIFFIEMIIIWIEIVYLSALKCVEKIVKGYMYGFVFTLLIFYMLLTFNLGKPIYLGMISINLGFLIIAAILMVNIIDYFRSEKVFGYYFEFLIYFDKYSELFWISLFYTLGIYIHNFIYWGGAMSITIFGTYRMMPFYDIAVFYAFMATLPPMIYFVVKVETNFNKYYRKYYYIITNEGKYLEIENAKNAMIEHAWRSIRDIAEVQIVILILFEAIGFILLPGFGLTLESMGAYRLISLGVFSCSIMYIIVLFLLYYDDRKGALMTMTTFLVVTTFVTKLSVFIEWDYHGFGFFIASTLALYVALFRFSYYLKNIDYYTFSAQPINEEDKSGFFTWILNYSKSKIENKEEIGRGV